MADPNVVNIKGLPRIEEIVNGNLLIVENEQGTNTLDFVNFVIGPNNTSFFNQITNLSAAVVSLSATTTSLINSLCATTNAQIQSLSTTISNTISGIFYKTGVINIPVGFSVSTSVEQFSIPASMTIDANDFTLTLGGSALPLSSVPVPYMRDTDVSTFSNVVSFYVRLTNVAYISAVPVRYRVIKPYSV